MMARGFLAAILLFCAGDGLAWPRPPLPPLPELAGPVLFHAGFDEAYSPRRTNAEVVVPDDGTLVESWSGYALRRSGWFVPPFLVPALDADGHPNVACEAAGALRFWLRPGWSSPALGGAGSGTAARLLELAVTDGKEAAVVWSLQVTPEGSGVVLLGQTETGLAPLLKADIAWSAGDWHQLGLDYGPGGTALFVDGRLMAEGAGTWAVPAPVAVLVVGSTLAGTEAAEAEFEELHAFGRPLRDTALSYRALAGQAALGPVSDAEWQARQEALAKARAAREAALVSAEDGGGQALRLVGPTSTCLTNVDVRLTNLVCALLTNQGWTVTFDIQDGTNGLLYDVFATTNVSGTSITNSQWVWLERGPPCRTYQYTNQPAPYAFYVLGDATLDPDGDDMTDAWEGLVSHTDPTVPQPPFRVFITLPDANTLLP